MVNLLSHSHMFKVQKVFIAAIFLLIIPFTSDACEIRPYAKAYVDKIDKVMGGKKPMIIIEKGTDDNRYGFYGNGVIHVFKDDYRDECIYSKPFLKSVIAHEYSHHMQKKLSKITNLQGERLAFVAEHAIGDEILNGALYDNVLDDRDIPAYNKIRQMLAANKIKNGLNIQERGIYMKLKK